MRGKMPRLPGLVSVSLYAMLFKRNGITSPVLLKLLPVAPKDFSIILIFLGSVFGYDLVQSGHETFSFLKFANG